MGKIIRKIDEFKYIHYIDITDELGRGGQGVVYATKDADTAIKIALNAEQPIKNKNEIKRFHQKVKSLIYKPLPSDIKIAKPLTVLQDEAGYVMNLLNGMESFAKLFPGEMQKEDAQTIEIPDFLQALYKKDKRRAFYFAYYLKTGGLRKRLYALSRVATILYRLHIRGLIYFDISQNNIFINQDDIPLAYFIDADNIEYESVNQGVIYTPNFEVPEVVKGEPNSLYSDIYAFGILAFWTLTTTHPFMGEGLEQSDWDNDTEKTKKPWELPWIEDTNDDSNRSKAGLRHTLTITKELSSLFHTLFEEGKSNKYRRPTLPLWIESLEKAASKTIKCINCKMSYYDDIFDVCPYCDEKKPKRVVATAFLYKEGQKRNERWRLIKEIEHDTKSIELPYYLFKSFNMLKIDDTFLEIKFPKKSKVELHFVKNDEDIYFESKTPIVNTKKRIGLKKMEEGISVIVDDEITILVEIKIEQ